MTQQTESKFNRSKFKDSTSSDALKAADKSVENVVRTNQRGNYAGFHTIENGINKFVLMPSHESIKQMMSDDDIKGEPFVVPKQIFWLPREVEDKDEKGAVKKDKKGNAIMKVINYPVMDARIHSEVKRDIVDVYINTFKKQLEEELGTGKDAEAAIKERMLIVYGSYQKHIQGIVGKASWIMYAEKITGDQKVFGRLEIGKAVKMRINELIAIEEANMPIGTETNNPFTDIELRRALTIKYNSKAEDAKLYYITEIDSDIDKDPKSPTYKQVKFYPIPDQQLEEFLKFPSLSLLYKNCYTTKDFDYAISGLKMFDDKHELAIFSNKDFLDEAEHMRKLFPEPKEEEVVAETAGTEEESGDKFDNMDRDEMKEYARKNKTGIVIHSKLKDEELRDLLKDWESNQEADSTDSGAEKKVETAAEKQDREFAETLEKKPSAQGVRAVGSSGETAAERIAKMRKGGK